MVSLEEELKVALEKICSPLVSIKEVKDLYFQAKERFFNESEIGRVEALIATNIFLHGYNRVYEYLTEKEAKGLTDEELDLVLVLCDEASANFDYLTEVFSDDGDKRISNIFSREENRNKQEQIKGCRENVIEEKAKRKVQQEQNNSPGNNDDIKTKIKNSKNELLSESSARRIRGLKKEVDFLRSKNKPKEADRLQEKINKIKTEKINNNNSFSPSSFLMGFEALLVIGFIIFLAIRIRKKK